MIRLRGLTWQHPRGYDPLVATARAFHEAHDGISIEWNQRPWSEFRRLQYEQSAGRTSPGYDLITFDHPWVGDHATSGLLMPVDDWMSPAERSSLEADADPASLQSYMWAGKLWGLPIDASCHVVVFRPDLLGTETLPDNWPELFDLAMRRHRPPDQYAFTVPWGHGSTTILFLIGLMAALGVHPFEPPQDREATLTAGREALAVMRAIWKASVPPARLPGKRSYDLMLAKDVATVALGSFAFINYFSERNTRPLAIGREPILQPTGTRISMLGGAGLGVLRGTPHPGPATEYARFVMNADVQGGPYIENEGQPGSLAALRRPHADARRTNFCLALAHALEDCYTRPTYPGWIRVEKGADDELAAFLDGQCQADIVLERLMQLASEALGS